MRKTGTGDKSWRRLALWLWLFPAGAVCAFFLTLFPLGRGRGPLSIAMLRHFGYYCVYGAIPAGLLGAASSSVAAALSERRAERGWLRWLLCAAGHGLFGLALYGWFEVLLSV